MNTSKWCLLWSKSCKIYSVSACPSGISQLILSPKYVSSNNFFHLLYFSNNFHVENNPIFIPKSLSCLYCKLLRYICRARPWVLKVDWVGKMFHGEAANKHWPDLNGVWPTQRDSTLASQLVSTVAIVQFLARRWDSELRMCTDSPFGTCAGDGQVVHDSNIYILLGIIYHTVDGVYVKASVFRAEEFGRILWR